MSAQNAKDAADNFVALLRLPAKSEAKPGAKYQLVTFASESDCRFFYPRRALNWQLQFNTFISRALRERHGIRVRRIALTPADFFASVPAVVRPEKPGVEEAARKFADSHLKLL